MNRTSKKEQVFRSGGFSWRRLQYFWIRGAWPARCPDRLPSPAGCPSGSAAAALFLLSRFGGSIAAGARKFRFRPAPGPGTSGEGSVRLRPLAMRPDRADPPAKETAASRRRPEAGSESLAWGRLRAFSSFSGLRGGGFGRLSGDPYFFLVLARLRPPAGLLGFLPAELWHLGMSGAWTGAGVLGESGAWGDPALGGLAFGVSAG
jgi:hypothetical protein